MPRARKALFAWRHSLCSAEGPSSQERLVGLVLSLYLNSDGLGAWPSGATLAIRSGLALRTVRPSLKRLCEQGWLTRQARKGPRGIRAPRWGFEYRATLPKKLSNAFVNGEADALFTGKDPGKLRPKSNGAKGDTSMKHPLPTNTSRECAKGDAFKKEEEERRKTEDLQRAFGDIP